MIRFCGIPCPLNYLKSQNENIRAFLISGLYEVSVKVNLFLRQAYIYHQIFSINFATLA
jgi:hypothetical protein